MPLDSFEKPKVDEKGRKKHQRTRIIGHSFLETESLDLLSPNNGLFVSRSGSSDAMLSLGAIQLKSSIVLIASKSCRTIRH